MNKGMLYKIIGALLIAISVSFFINITEEDYNTIPFYASALAFITGILYLILGNKYKK